MFRPTGPVKRLIRAAGYELLPVDYASNKLLERHLRRLFDFARIRCVLDVGGNLGQYRDFLRDAVRYDGWILSFEPVSAHVSHLEERAASDPRWRVFGFALGEQEGTLQINVTRGGDLSSFLTPREDRSDPSVDPRATLFDPRRIEVDHREDVEVKTLDQIRPLIEEASTLRHTYLKLDTQGHDLSVLRGAPGFLSELPALQTEVSFVPLYEGMPMFSEVQQYLEERGFEVSAMIAGLTDELFRTWEFDCVAVNSAVLR